MFRKCKKSDWKKGFKYQVWVGYEWWDVEVGKNGHTKEDFLELVKERELDRIRVKLPETHKTQIKMKRPITPSTKVKKKVAPPKKSAMEKYNTSKHAK